MSQRYVKKLVTFTVLINAITGWTYASQSTHVLSGPSGLSSSLGNSLTAYGFDASSAYYNPATLLTQNKNFYLEHTKKNIDASNSWAAFMAGDSTFKYGLSWNHLSLPLSSHRDQAYISLGFTPESLNLNRVPKELGFGLNLGYLNNRIFDESATAYYADLGTTWTKNEADIGYGLGLAAKNVYFSGLKFRTDGEVEKHPKEYDLGAFIRKWKFMGFSNLSKVNGNSAVSFGLQYEPIKLLSFRVGYNEVPGFGMGFNLKNMSINYGYKMGEVTSDQTISFSYRWDAPKDPDYTNPLLELESRHRSLEEFLVANLQKDMQALKPITKTDVLKIIIVQPTNTDAWNLFNSLTNEKNQNLSIPNNKSLRRDYLTLAIAYAESDPMAKDYVASFLKKYEGKKICGLVRLIQKYDFKK